MISQGGAMSLVAFLPFANPWMLVWASAAVIPILIHVLSRRRYDVVPWAAMDFLLAALRKHARRWRLEQWLLLAVRVAILVLLAVALANPILARRGLLSRAADAVGDTHWVLVLDASYSMDYRPAAVPRFELAKQLAGELVRAAPQGDGFSLLLMAGTARPIVEDPVFAREELLAELAALPRTDGGADLRLALAESQRIIERAAREMPRLRRHRVCFLTDLGRTTWDVVAEPDVRAAIARLGEQADLRLCDVGQEATPNLAVTELSMADGVVTVGQPTRLLVDLENFGREAVTALGVETLVDGQRIDRQQLDVSAAGRSTLAITHVFPIPGPHIVEVRTAGDRLPVDDQRWLSVTVQPAVEVLCVEGKPGAARHVLLALSPGSVRPARVRPAVQSDVVLLEEDLTRYDCIVLCNVGRLGADEIAVLRQFLAQGGGVIVWLGDQLPVPDEAARGDGEASAVSLLPVQVAGPVPLGDYGFDPLDYRHPIAAPFRGHERAGLLTTPIWRYVKIVSLDARTVRTALGFTTGDPAVLEAAVGRGKVILVATDTSSVDRGTTPATPWSALATWPSFPPLVQQMLDSVLRGRSALHNTLVGQALRGSVPPDRADATVTMTDPVGRTRRLAADPAGQDGGWTFTDTLRSGVYAVVPSGAPGEVQRYAVNVDTRESRLERVDATMLPNQLRAGDMEAAEPLAVIPAARTTHVFRYLLVAALLLVLCESFLAWFLGRTAADGPLVR